MLFYIIKWSRNNLRIITHHYSGLNVKSLIKANFNKSFSWGYNRYWILHNQCYKDLLWLGGGGEGPCWVHKWCKHPYSCATFIYYPKKQVYDWSKSIMWSWFCITVSADNITSVTNVTTLQWFGVTHILASVKTFVLVKGEV